MTMQLPLLDLPPDAAVQRESAVSLRTMHARYGVTDGRTCGECQYLKRLRYHRTYFKCGLTRQTGGAATDWRVGWQACGVFKPNDA